MTEIRGVGRARARGLWDAGFLTVRAVSVAKPEDLVHIRALGRYPEAAARMVTVTLRSTPTFPQIIRSAKELLQKNAEKLRLEAQEAEQILQAIT